MAAEGGWQSSNLVLRTPGYQFAYRTFGDSATPLPGFRPVLPPLHGGRSNTTPVFNRGVINHYLTVAVREMHLADDDFAAIRGVDLPHGSGDPFPFGD